MQEDQLSPSSSRQTLANQQSLALYRPDIDNVLDPLYSTEFIDDASFANKLLSLASPKLLEIFEDLIYSGKHQPEGKRETDQSNLVPESTKSTCSVETQTEPYSPSKLDTDYEIILAEISPKLFYMLSKKDCDFQVIKKLCSQFGNLLSLLIVEKDIEEKLSKGKITDQNLITANRLVCQNTLKLDDSNRYKLSNIKRFLETYGDLSTSEQVDVQNPDENRDDRPQPKRTKES